ncbi:hypothetical protein GCM10023324_57690 [Streptomyces youssoufiensis]
MAAATPGFSFSTRLTVASLTPAWAAMSASRAVMEWDPTGHPPPCPPRPIRARPPPARHHGRASGERRAADARQWRSPLLQELAAAGRRGVGVGVLLKIPGELAVKGV